MGLGRVVTCCMYYKKYWYCLGIYERLDLGNYVRSLP
jgi:hypothetical protein